MNHQSIAQVIVYLQLVGWDGRCGWPLVACRIAEFVSVTCRKVVQHGRSSRSYTKSQQEHLA
jgi:hypothetical protein